MDEKLDGVESATKQLKADADALTVSRDAKSTKSLKDDLAKAIADAQATYDASVNAVADEQTRTALQQAIGEAQTLADKPSLDKAAVDAAKEKLTNAVNAVVESQNALAEANAAVAQEALRQQQLQQQQAQQTQPGTTGADASTGLGTTTGGQAIRLAPTQVPTPIPTPAPPPTQALRSNPTRGAAPPGPHPARIVRYWNRRPRSSHTRSCAVGAPASV